MSTVSQMLCIWICLCSLFLLYLYDRLFALANSHFVIHKLALMDIANGVINRGQSLSDITRGSLCGR